jgi:2-polyprenyl-6-methoxyphenol hydroxylase-like FAD-dependent oxidoreductase
MLAHNSLPTGDFDVAIIGAGPVGLALAVELAGHGFATLVVDRRPPPAQDYLRPQVLVARPGDLANLAALGVNVWDGNVVSMLSTFCMTDLISRRTVCAEVAVRDSVPPPVPLAELSSQLPLALVPIGRLQQALLARALELGATVVYGCDVTRLRRHAHDVSLACANGSSQRAAIAVIATGASRSLANVVQVPRPTTDGATMIGAVFATARHRARWLRAELMVQGFVRPVRCTLLQTPEAGTALLVDPQVECPTPSQLTRCFAAVARVQGLGGDYLVEPQPFVTAVTSAGRRFVAGDGRAPVVLAGDAAQTGHVFTGQTCFVNIALARVLAEALWDARAPILERRPNASLLLASLLRYKRASIHGEQLLATASQRHLSQEGAGRWAFAGVSS